MYLSMYLFVFITHVFIVKYLFTNVFIIQVPKKVL